MLLRQAPHPTTVTVLPCSSTRRNQQTLHTSAGIIVNMETQPACLGVYPSHPPQAVRSSAASAAGAAGHHAAAVAAQSRIEPAEKGTSRSPVRQS